jgi:hypothetical protein
MDGGAMKRWSDRVIMGYGMLHDDNEVKIDDIVATYDDE